jgi:formylglycine-generating enzyme required for sulfatase activity
VVAGSISKFGTLYILSLRLISGHGTDVGVIRRESEKCECTDKELVDVAESLAKKLMGEGTSDVITIIGLTSMTRSTASTSSTTNSSSTTSTIPSPDAMGMKFVHIDPGTFMMGSKGGLFKREKGREKDETRHQVTLTKGFYMQTTEVTQGQWRAVIGNNPSYFKDCGDNCPVEQVSWEDCQKFIKRLNQQEGGNKYRLPTEAMWEYACRAGTTGPYAGSLDTMGWYSENSGGRTHPVAEKSPNAWGLYDMHGNVWEWCEDWYDDYPKGSVTDPKESYSSSPFRVFRGDCYLDFAKYYRSADRFSYDPGYRDFALGFRLSRAE